MSTHTPGPWQAIGDATTPNHVVACDDWIADTNNANARLIAAAPDLLAVLREIDTIVNESASECRKRMGTRLGNILVAARAAIAKAEGTS